MSAARLPYHPYANLLPMMSPAERSELKAAIARDGQRRPIVLDDTGILDGRNRYEICLDLGLVPRTRPYDPRPAPAGDGPDRLAFVLAENVERRHLDESQRAMVAARLATMRQGERTDLAAENGEPCLNLSKVDQETAAEMLKVSRSLLQAAKIVQDKGTAELKLAVDTGQLAVSAAKQAATLAPEVQRQIALDAAAGKANVVRTAIKQGARAGREDIFGAKVSALPDEKFGVIVEDFEWDHVTWSEAGRDRAAENHYPVSKDAHTAAEIVERTKERWACADDRCVAYMWTTIQHLAIAIDVLRQRGFDYVSSHAWGKDKIGLGFWNREKHEILLIGTRGNPPPPCPAPGTQLDSLVMAPRGEHSVKPDEFLEMIERHFPTTPRLELNARRRRPGWQAWGNEVEPGKPEIIALERKALALGLIDANGMVQVTSSATVGFPFVTENEWRDLLARAAKTATPIDGDQADLAAALADPQCADMAARATPFPDSKIFTESNPTSDPLDIPAFLQRKADSSPPAGVAGNRET